MPNALYRINGGEVIKISTVPTPQTWPDRDATYFGVLVDPTFPDGTEILDGTGAARVLGFAKFADVPGTSVRNATQPEIDAWDAAETADENQQDADGGEDLFDTHPRWRKVFKAMLKELRDEFNRIRTNPKAQIVIRTGTTTQVMAPGTWAQITLFNDARGFNILDHDTLTADKANNRIIANQNGIYLVQYQISFAGSGDTEFRFDVGIDAGLSNSAVSRRTLGSAGAVGSCSGVGFINVTGQPVDIGLAGRNEESTNRDLTIIDCQLVVTRLPNRATLTLQNLVDAIKTHFDPGD